MNTKLSRFSLGLEVKKCASKSPINWLKLKISNINRTWVMAKDTTMVRAIWILNRWVMMDRPLEELVAEWLDHLT